MVGDFIWAQCDRLRWIRLLDVGRAIDLTRGYVHVNVSPFRNPVINPEDVRPQLEKGFYPVDIERGITGDRSQLRVRKAVDAIRVAVLIGDPGAAKSTELRHLCMESVPSAPQVVPVFLTVRDMSAYEGIWCAQSALYSGVFQATRMKSRRMACALGACSSVSTVSMNWTRRTRLRRELVSGVFVYG